MSRRSRCWPWWSRCAHVDHGDAHDPSTSLASDPAIRERTLGVITVATPHQGTALAARLPVGPLAFLALHNAWVVALPGLAALVPRVRSFATDVDVIVYPPATCVAGEHELLHGIGHAPC